MSVLARITARSTLIGLAAITASAFAVAAILGNGRHGALKAVADVAWTAMWIAAVVLILVGVAALVRTRSASR